QEKNHIEDIKSCAAFYNKLVITVKSISQHARSLIYNLDSNVAEHFHSVIANFVGGKRIDFSKGGSYQSRCYASVVSFNSKSLPHYTLHKTLSGKYPLKIKTEFERRRSKKVKKVLEYRRKLKRTATQKHKKSCHDNEDPDYGVFSQKPNMDEVEYNSRKKEFLDNLSLTEESKAKFEKDTILQSGSSLWLEERRKLLTASNFHSVCTRRPTTSCVNLVKRLLYSGEIICPSLRHGKENEPLALKKLEGQLNKNVSKCGMFVDEKYPFLGSSPGGIIEEDGGEFISQTLAVIKFDIEVAVVSVTVKLLSNEEYADMIQIYEEFSHNAVQPRLLPNERTFSPSVVEFDKQTIYNLLKNAVEDVTVEHQPRFPKTWDCTERQTNWSPRQEAICKLVLFQQANQMGFWLEERQESPSPTEVGNFPFEGIYSETWYMTTTKTVNA
ncbi:hypothetical protein ILUMI_02966, partial [Ignelater luminosus]